MVRRASIRNVSSNTIGGGDRPSSADFSSAHFRGGRGVDFSSEDEDDPRDEDHSSWSHDRLKGASEGHVGVLVFRLFSGDFWDENIILAEHFHHAVLLLITADKQVFVF